MLIIYDKNGTIITENTLSTDIVGNLNYLDVVVQEGKILNRIDVSVTPNVPVFIDIPKSDIEQLQQQFNLAINMLSKRDLEHDTSIKDIMYKLDKLDTFVKNNLSVAKEVK